LFREQGIIREKREKKYFYSAKINTEEEFTKFFSAVLACIW
jgi:hypothetical protein